MTYPDGSVEEVSTGELFGTEEFDIATPAEKLVVEAAEKEAEKEAKEEAKEGVSEKEDGVATSAISEGATAERGSEATGAVEKDGPGTQIASSDKSTGGQKSCASLLTADY